MAKKNLLYLRMGLILVIKFQNILLTLGPTSDFCHGKTQFYVIFGFISHPRSISSKFLKLVQKTTYCRPLTLWKSQKMKDSSHGRIRRSGKTEKIFWNFSTSTRVSSSSHLCFLWVQACQLLKNSCQLFVNNSLFLWQFLGKGFGLKSKIFGIKSCIWSPKSKNTVFTPNFPETSFHQTVLKLKSN